jgi:hypothetical protein
MSAYFATIADGTRANKPLAGRPVVMTAQPPESACCPTKDRGLEKEGRAMGIYATLRVLPYW